MMCTFNEMLEMSKFNYGLMIKCISALIIISPGKNKEGKKMYTEKQYIQIKMRGDKILAAINKNK